MCFTNSSPKALAELRGLLIDSYTKELAMIVFRKTYETFVEAVMAFEMVRMILGHEGALMRNSVSLDKIEDFKSYFHALQAAAEGNISFGAESVAFTGGWRGKSVVSLYPGGTINIYRPSAAPPMDGVWNREILKELDPEAEPVGDFWEENQKKWEVAQYLLEDVQTPKFTSEDVIVEEVSRPEQKEDT